MPDELDQLLRRPEVVAAVGELEVDSLALEDVLAALRSFGRVQLGVDHDAEHPFICMLDGGAERTRGRTVLHAAIACWAQVLEGLHTYTRQGLDEFERFLLDPDVA